MPNLSDVEFSVDNFVTFGTTSTTVPSFIQIQLEIFEVCAETDRHKIET